MFGQLVQERNIVGRVGRVIAVERPLIKKFISEITREDIKQARDATRIKVLFLSPFIGEDEEEWFTLDGVRFL